MRKIFTKPLILAHLIILLLFISWAVFPTNLFWDYLDRITFNALNKWIATSHFWQGFWAICNHALLDWVHDVFMLLFFAAYISRAKDAGERRKRTMQLLYCIIYFALAILLVNQLLLHEIINPRRKSPTMVSQNPVLLSKIVNWIHIKDHSKTCYPSDHATTGCLFIFAVFYFMGPRAGILATLYCLFLCLPRLVVGAHWLTDITMGSVPITLFASSWALFTPLARLFTISLPQLYLKYYQKYKESYGRPT